MTLHSFLYAKVSTDVTYYTKNSRLLCSHHDAFSIYVNKDIPICTGLQANARVYLGDIFFSLCINLISKYIQNMTICLFDFCKDMFSLPVSVRLKTVVSSLQLYHTVAR